MPFITVDGCEIYYEEVGKGKPLVFAPGFMGVTDIWRHQFKYFSKNYRCISYDIRGCGRSDKPFPRISYGVERHMSDLKSVLDFLKVQTFVVVGHSMGGNTACLYALDYPELVAGIVLVGSYASGKQIRDTGRTIELYQELMKTKPARVKAFQDVGLSEEIALESAKWPLYSVMGNAASFLEFDIADRLKNITAPTLVIHGDGDIVSPLDPCGLYLAKQLPNSTLTIFKKTNHCPHSEKPLKFNKILESFLKGKTKW